MRGFAHVFLLELRLRRAVFPAALIAGLIPIPLALMMTGVATFSEALDVGASAFALIGGELLALYLGATVLCQDLSEGRQGFYFARPISGIALWAGKFSAAWVAVLGAMLVVLLPATLMGEGLAKLQASDNPLWVYDIGPQTISPLWGPVFAALGVLLLMGFAHAVSLMFRSRSAWLVLDGAMVVLLPTLAWWGLKRLTFSWETLGLLTVLLLAYAAAALLAVLPAGALQTALGRCDLKRGHKILSLTMWGTASAAVLGVSAYAYHVTHLAPWNLAAIEYASPAPAGDWAVISGPAGGMARNIWPSFLVNTKTGVWVPVAGGRWNYGPVLSPDGKMALGLETEGMGYRAPWRLVSYDLAGSAAPKPEAHGVFTQGGYTRLSFSPDSTRLAMLVDRDLSVLDVSTWKVLAVQRLPGREGRWERYDLAFTDRDHLSIFWSSTGPKDEPGSTIMEFDVAGKKLLQTGHMDVRPMSIQLDAHGRSLLVVLRGQTGRDLALCDARTGAILRTLIQDSPHVNGRFLSDGRILATERDQAETVVRLFSPEGEPVRAYSLGTSRFAWTLTQQGASQVLVTTWEPKTDMTRTGDVRRLDLASGTAQILPGIKPCWGFWSSYDYNWWGVPARQAPWGLFLDEQGKVVRYDFATGKSEAVKMGT